MCAGCVRDGFAPPLATLQEMKGGGEELQEAALPVVIPMMHRLYRPGASVTPPGGSVGMNISSGAAASSSSQLSPEASSQLLPALRPVLESLEGRALVAAVARTEELAAVIPRSVDTGSVDTGSVDTGSADDLSMHG